MKKFIAQICAVCLLADCIAQDQIVTPLPEYRLSVFTSIGPALFFSEQWVEEALINNHFNGDYNYFSLGSINLEINYPKSDHKGSFMRGFGVAYNLNNKSDVGAFVNSNFKYIVKGYRSNDGAFIEMEFNEWSFGAFAQYKLGIFEVELGPAFQVFNFHFTDFSNELGYYTFQSSHRKQGVAFGLTTGFQFAIPKRISMFDYILGFKLNYFFTKGSTPALHVSANGSDISFPSIDYKFTFMQFYFAFRFNFLDKNKK